MASSGSFTDIYSSNNNINFGIGWYIKEQSIEDNTSIIGIWTTLKPQVTLGFEVPCNWSITIGPQRQSGSITFDHLLENNDYAPFMSDAGTLADVTVPHNEDGSMVMEVRVRLEFGTGKASQGSPYPAPYTGGTIDFVRTAELDQIPREITLSSAPNFTDEQNPKITYANPAGDGATSLVLDLLSADEKTVYATRNLNKTATSYTMSLTTAERNKIRTAASTVNSIPVVFRLTLTIGTYTSVSKLTRTCSIVNAMPTITATVTKISDDADSLTGSQDMLILHYSSVNYTITATALKGATIVSVKAVCGNQSFTTTSGTFNAVDSGTFVFSVQDSRGNVNSYTIERQYIDYTRLTCVLELGSPTTDGDLDFTINGNYSPINFGLATNELVVQYRYREEQGEYGNWITVNPTVSGNSYTVYVSISGLDYKTQYRFQARAMDKLLLVESDHIPAKTRPVFDWSNTDFNFNVPVTITDGYLKYPLMGLINAMTKTYVCDVTAIDGANYTITAVGATICGNILRCNFTASRNSATGSGNITNETVLTFSIYHGGKINNMLNVCFGNGENGHVASFLTNNISYKAETLDFSVQVSATGGATNEFSTYFQVPISINLDKFVEE